MRSEVVAAQFRRTCSRLLSQDQANLAPLPREFTRALAADIWGVPPMTASHRLTGLVDAGMIERVGTFKSGWYRRVL